MVKVDFHVHSELSHDGGLSMADIERVFAGGMLDVMAITDHNEIDFALAAHKKWGEKIIVGEEVKTRDGEVIGLFLKEKIDMGLGLVETCQEIRRQGGIVVVPHPGDGRRSAVACDVVIANKEYIDAVEVFNARMITPGLQGRVDRMVREGSFPVTVASDSHGLSEIGRTYMEMEAVPTAQTLLGLLKDGRKVQQRVGIGGFFNPFRNKMHKRLALRYNTMNE